MRFLTQILCILGILLLFTTEFYQAHAQVCVDEYFYSDINTATVQEPNSSILSSQNEILVAGDVSRQRSLLKEGWVSKYSARGTVLWSRRYYTASYNYVIFRNILQDGNDAFIVTGHVGDVDTTTWPVTPISRFAFVMKVNKYGEVVWSKTLNNGNVYIHNNFSEVQSAIKTNDGGYALNISYLNTNNFNDYRIITKIDAAGNIRWQTSINGAVARSSMGNARIMEIKNGNIFFATNFTQLNQTLNYLESGYYLASIDNNTGLRKWERFYIGMDSLSPTQRTFGEITGMTEFPDGNLSFISSYAANSIQNFRTTTQIQNFVIDSLGNYRKLYTYTTNTTPFYASSAIQNNAAGNRVVLMDNADAPFLMEIQPDGNIQWQKSYAAIGRSQETRSVLTSSYGNYFFSFTHDGGSKTLKIVKTDLTGGIPCVEKNSEITMEDLTPTYTYHTLNLIFKPADFTWNDFAWMNSNNYQVNEDRICSNPCCSNITVTAAEVNLCNKPYYILPNADTVKSSGTYAAVLKTTSGCDSIVYYPVDFGYTPKVNIGNDRCMGGKDTIVLNATTGYGTYYWNSSRTESSSLVVREPGTYVVSVTERCGTATDTLVVYNQCSFEIKMPNVFTPNGDGRNDIFRVPPQINNRLISFTVFNRWGQVVFSSADMSKGWDGQINNQPAPAGTYVYYVVMRSLDNWTNVSGKGTVTLLR